MNNENGFTYLVAYSYSENARADLCNYWKGGGESNRSVTSFVITDKI